MKKSILKSISDYIKSKEDYFTSENIETNKIPVFLVYTTMSNDREKLYLYFDYKTSKQYINRAIFSLGYYEDFSEQDKKEIIKTAILSLKKLGIKAHPTKSDYQGSGYKKNPKAEIQKHKVDWIKEPLSEEDFKTLTDYYSNKFVAAKIRWFDEKSGEGFVRLSEGPLKGFSVFVHGSAFGGDQNFGQETAFKATDDLPVLVKLILDWNYIQVHRMKEDKGIKKNPDSNRAVAAKIRNPRRVEDINMSQFLFCYGSNNIDQLKERLGHEIKAFPAFISGYRRAFRGYSERWQGGVATLIKKEGHTYGLAIKVNDHDIKKLDKYEGYPTYYTRKNLKVNVDGKIETCVVYLSNSKEQNDPSKAYLKAIYKTVSTFWDVNSPNDFYNKNPESKKCIFQTPVQMRDFLNKHLKDRWSWRKNEIVVQAGQANWKIARAVEDFFTLAGFAGAGSEMDNIGNVVVRAYVPKSIMALKDKE